MDEFVSASSFYEHRHDQTRERKAMLKQEYIFYVETNKIKPNPNQPRQEFDSAALEGLAASIKEFGLLQPIVVSRHETETPHGRDVEYHLIAGERRWRAAAIAGLPTMPAIIREEPSEEIKLELALIENIQRADLNPIETAKAYQRLVHEFGLTQKAIADRMGKSQESVSNNLRLLTLPEKVQQAIAHGHLSEGHARAILALHAPEKQLNVFEEILTNQLSVRDTEERVRALKAHAFRSGANVVSLNPHFKQLIEILEDALGTKVTLVPKGDGGRLTIEYFSAEELESILRRFAKPIPE